MAVYCTVIQLAERTELNLEHVPTSLRDVRVVINPRLRVALGRHCRRGYDQWIDLHPNILTSTTLYREVAAHEIAHAVVPLDGHGWKWRSVCAKLGGIPRQYIPADICKAVGIGKERHKHVASCAKCGFKLHKAQRLKPGRIYSHVNCGGRFVSILGGELR